MLNHLKALSKDSFAYSISNIVTRASSFILLPVYARLFAPADIGVVNLINVTYFFISSVTLFCLDSAAVVFYWKDEIQDKTKIFASWFWFVVVVNVLVCLGITLFSTGISQLILGEPRYSLLFVLAFAAGLFNILPLLYNNYLRISRRPFVQLKLSIVTAALNIIFTVFFLYYIKSGIVGIFYSQLAAAVISTGICFFLFRKNIRLASFDFSVLRRMLAFSIPVIPTTITFWLSNSISLYSISYFYDKHEVGLYNVASSIASVINIVIGAVSQAVLPFALSINKDENAKKIYAKIFQTYFLVLGLIGFTISLFSKEILVLIATDKFAGSELVLIFLVFNSILIGSNTIAGIGLNIAQKMKSLLLISAICTIANVAGIFILVPLLGKEGGAIAAMASSCFLVILTLKSAQKFYFIPYNYLVPTVSIVGYLFFSLLFYFSSNDFSVTIMLVKATFCLVAFSAIFYHTRRTLSLA